MEQPLGAQDRDFVCNSCFKSYTVRSRSWRNAEALPCLHCGSKNTTPMIEVKVGFSRVKEYSFGPTQTVIRSS
jgi:hypothetical protein